MNKSYFIIFFVVLLSACNTAADGPVKSPPGYDLSKPEKFIMPDVLLEISGIAFNQGNNDTLYAQQDEDGKLFYLKLGEKKVKSFKFSKRGDYEDVSIMNGQVFLLRSYGTLFSFPLSSSKQEEEESTVKQWEGLLPDGEFEAMYADPASHSVYVLCKQCSQDKGTETVSGYVLEWVGDSSLVRTRDFSINTQSISEPEKKGRKMRFEPSAIATHPLTGEWYILSSVNKLLVVADSNWTVKDVYPLDPARFRQPEGIAFDSRANLYISNEGDELSNGNVLKFSYTANAKP